MAITFDVVSGFNRTGVQPAAGNPFSYGTETSLNTSFTLFPNFQANGTVSVGSGQFTTNGTLANYYIAEAISGPSVGAVATGGPLNFANFFTIPNDVLMMMPGDAGLGTAQIAVTRFTAPDTAVFDITGSFADLQSATVSLAVVVNGLTVFTGGFSGQHGTIPFSISNVHLDAGATVDFIVDSLGNRANDVLGLKALITETNAANSPPTITSGAGDTAAVSVAENSTTVTTVKATDPDAGDVLTYSIIAGADKDQFTINDKSGVLTFKTAPDFENPTDTGKNNVYDLTVKVSDGHGGTDTQAIAVTVTNVLGITKDGGNGGQTLTGTMGEDTLTGGNGKDVLIGGDNNDTLSAGNGNDVLNGGAGNDTMDGGNGNDVFILAAGFGNDRVLGFDAKGDLLDISAFIITSATFAARVTIEDVGADTLVTIDNDAAQTIRLVGINDATTVTQADFIL